MQANRPAKAGSSSELAPLGNAAPPLGAVTPPPPVHHDLAPRAAAPPVAAPRATAGHRVARPTEPRQPRQPRDRIDPGVGPLAWLPYLIVLAGVAAGMFIAWRGSQYAGRGTGLVGCSLLAAGLARLILPPRYAGLLSTRRKASDVLAFAVFGAAVLAVALMLP